MSVNLTELVRDVYRDTPALSLRDAALAVAGQVPDDDVRECFAVALISYVRDQHSKMRQGNPIVTGSLFSQAAAASHTDNPNNRSHKVEAIREWWAHRINDPIGTPSGVKPLGDCTIADIDYAATVRRRIAHANLVSAINYEKLAAHMRDAGVTTVRELNPM